MHVLIVDDEPLARSRLRLLLSDCQDPIDPFLLSEAASASQAMQVLQQNDAVDVVLLDIQMPGTSGMSLAHTLQQQAQPPLLIFVTAHSQYAAQAFDVQACDYLTKPVRLQRLQQALHKARQLRQLQPPRSTEAMCAAAALTIPSASGTHGHTERLPLAQVAYIQAELKTLTVHTLTRSLLIDGSLLELEQRFGAQLLRCHRSYLVNLEHICALEKTQGTEDGEGWVLHLHSLPQRLPVSRRQLPIVRAALAQRAL
ncbi:MAG: LytTR family DNA-binding domain-containing protein [Comamonas sp.]|jgi:two-component system, LytTR family, response regulator AlgR|nr:LytTR family DNA-binding domain-containing protein [Comamonas sp.]